MAEHTLILLRHAKSDWSGDEPDVARPLAKRGRRQAPEAGRWLAAHFHRLDLALVSPAERARETWTLVESELPHPPRTRLDDRLYAAPAGTLLEVLREVPEDLGTVVLVGHNPGLQDLLERLTGDEVAMPTSAVAVIDVPGSWADVGRIPASLRVCGRPPAG